MAQIEERLVDLINLASVEVDGNKKVDYLYQIKELALNHGLTDNFFQDILAFQNDRLPSVKKFVLAFIEAACKNDCQLCPRAILSLNLLLNDTNTEIVKRSVQAATQFYRALIQWIVNVNDIKVKGSLGAGQSPLSPKQQHQQQQLSQPQQLQSSDAVIEGTTYSRETDSDIEKTWLMWSQMKNFICGLLETTNNDGVRTHCIKFIEAVVLMQTPRDKYTDTSHELNLIDPMIAPIKLTNEAASCGILGLPKNGVLFNEEHKLESVEDAKKRFEQLVVFHGTSHISSVNLMAAMQSLVVLAKQRYRLFMGRVIQAMESLHNKLPPTLTESQVQSVKKFLKLQLTVMLKHPYSLDRFQLQLTQLLQAVGSRAPEITRVINEFKNKFGNDSLAANNSITDTQKRIKLEPGVKQQSQAVGSQGGSGSQSVSVGRSKNLDLNKLTQELDDREKLRIIVESLRRILTDESNTIIPPAQMAIKKDVLSTLAYEFRHTECPKLIQDYIFRDIKNRHEISYAVIRKNFDIASKKATVRKVNLLEHQELLKSYFDCYNSYLNCAMDLKDSKDRDIILPKLYALREEYYNLTNQDQDQEPEQEQGHEQLQVQDDN